jgi:hypothetical protein
VAINGLFQVQEELEIGHHPIDHSFDLVSPCHNESARTSTRIRSNSLAMSILFDMRRFRSTRMLYDRTGYCTCSCDDGALPSVLMLT